MALESPATYGEWYWRMSLDAANALSEEYEKSFAPIVSGLIAELTAEEALPASLKAYYAMLASPPSPGWHDAQRAFMGVMGRAVELTAGEEMARPFKYKHAASLLTMQIDAETAIILNQRKRITEDLYNGRMRSAGFAAEEARHIYNARMPYPSIPDLITYARYHGPADSPKEGVWSLFDVSEKDWPIWEWLSFQKPTTEQVLSLYKRKFMTELETRTELARLGWPDTDKPAILDLAYTIPNAMLLVQGGLFQEFSKEGLLDGISIADIHPDYAQLYLDAILTKPATQDIIAYELRQDPNLSDLDKQLRKIGIHPDYHALYKELAYQIPPVADIITMAVREAFTPEIASRFGQYEGLPTQFVEWVGKKGLSKEWAERYWAAHWSLPSPSQGFEMLQRGIISRDDLALLLRALDIMPFWRDKLIQISYNPLTRVDIRRMYALDILNKTEVHKAYQDIGYTTENAARLTLFTVKLTEQAEARAATAKAKAAIEKGVTWTTAQTLSFLKKGLITADRAEQEFILLGYNAERIRIYLASVVK